MSRIPFKRQLIILVCIITALCVAIPVATFAKGTPPGEQKRHEQPKITHTAQGTTVTITTDCSSVPLQLLTTLQVGDTLTGSASLTSSDPDEESEGETLVLQEQNSKFTKTILTLDVATGTATIPSVTATVANDNINACINGIDSDETGTVTFTVTPPSKQKTLFVLLPGISSVLEKGDIKMGQTPGFTEPGHIVPFLKANGYGDAQFLTFSYKGSTSDGQPKPYMCQDSFTNSIAAYDSLLANQIIEAVNAIPHNPTINIYLIGHSLGGAIAYAYLTGLLDGNGVLPSLPPNAHLKGVITLDSPIGGISDEDLYLEDALLIFDQKCSALTPSHKPPLPLDSLNSLIQIFKTASGDSHGADASMLKAIFGGKHLNNEDVAIQAKQQGISILTVGNTHDLLWDPHLCDFTLPSFRSTQWLDDQGDDSGIYGRVFVTPFACINGIFQQGNHLAVLQDGNVEAALVQFLPDGGTPSALDVAPN